MKLVILVSWWTLWTAFTLLNLADEAAGAARFLSHVPHDYIPDGGDDADDDAFFGSAENPVHHDADVKLPGRHYPRLPYDLDFSATSYDRFVGLPSTQSDTAGHQHLPGNPPGPPPPQVQDTSPRFDRNQPRSVAVQAGKTAVLVCRVLNIGNKSVSWMRHEDLHILTVDKYKYSTDGRVSIVYNESEQEWLLKIKGVRPTDAGRYECQVSTKPVLSFIVNMEVLDEPPPTTPYPNLRDAAKPADAPRTASRGDHRHPEVRSATILNGPEIHVHRGSLINLTCIVDHTAERPLYIVWYHYNKVIDYDETGVVVMLTQSGHNTISHLLVRDAEPSDSGKYTCRPSNGEDDSVMLHVLNGEHPAAMHTNAGTRSGRSLPDLFVGAFGLASFLFLCRCR